MFRNVSLIIVGAVLGAIAMFGLQLRPAPVPRVEAHKDLESAFTAFANSLRDAGTFVQGHQWYGTDTEQAEAYRHIARVMINVLSEGILVDPDFPYFYEIGPFSKTGMDNSDQRYLSTLINAQGTYRVWGTRGSSRRLDFSVYEQDALSQSLATLNTEQLQVDPDGTFEVFIGGPAREGNWLPLDAAARRLLVRQIHSDWGNETPGDLHIDRIDAGRPLYPVLNSDIMAARLLQATDLLALNVRRWPEYSRTRFDALLPANTLTAPRDTGATGGLSGRLMVGGHFELAADEALLIKAWPTAAQYHGIQLGHHWWESLDYANRQSSLTADQAAVSSDGALYFVVSSRDPGVANWLDTEGFHRGVIMMRYDGLPGAGMAEERHPYATLVKLGELAQHLPPDEPRIGAEQRRQQIAARRRHVQKRFGI
ncbi:MAG: hypothetical protein R3228_01240 [Halioglobus sp.]|nr:hypothetical protein [Halioglobus sp.]